MFLTSCASGGVGNAYNYYEEGEYQKTIAKVDRCILNYQYPPETLAQLYLLKAKSYEKLGDEHNARSVYQYIYDNFPQSSVYSAAIEKLL